MTLQEHKASESLNDEQYRNLLRFAQEIRRQIECPLQRRDKAESAMAKRALGPVHDNPTPVTYRTRIAIDERPRITARTTEQQR
jgi:hypothetical protein